MPGKYCTNSLCNMTLIKFSKLRTGCISILILLLTGTLQAQLTAQMKGTVVSEAGELLAGVTVIYNATGNADKKTVLTNDKGIFIISKLSEGVKYDLIFSYVGYEEQKMLNYTFSSKDNNS